MRKTGKMCACLLAFLVVSLLLPFAWGEVRSPSSRRPEPDGNVPKAYETTPQPGADTLPPAAAARKKDAESRAIVDAGGIDITADRLEYESDKKLLVGVGNVVVRQGQETLSADCISVHTETHDSYATGNVVYESKGKVWKGAELTYNFDTGVGNFGEFSSFVEPYYIRGEQSQQISADEYIVENATITTCEGDMPDFFVRASEAHILEGTKIRARNVVIFLGAIPIFYLPFWKYDLGREKTNIDVVPGYSSRWGAYVLTAINYQLSMKPYLRGATHFDYRSKRGMGYGQDVIWRGLDTNRPIRGMVTGYYIDDKEPFRNEEEEAEQGDLIDNQRYRVRLDHSQALGERTWLLGKAQYLSDPDVLEDFFRKEYRDTRQPENQVSLTHSGDRFTAGALVNKRLNDFYENVDRLPELSLSFPRLQIGESPFYYAGENSAAFLSRVFPEDSDSEEYDAVRLDSAHMLYYPTRHFGFLNIIPRAGYRATYYSKTREESAVTNQVAVTDTNDVPILDADGLPLTSNDVDRVLEERGAQTRSLYEFGVENSFKAFKVFSEPDGTGNGGWRHVAEPYANYTYVLEPNVLPSELYQFDGIDELGKKHFIRLGMRNKLQTKRNTRVADWLDADVYADYLIEPEEDENDFDPLNFDVEMRPTKWLSFDFDGKYEWYEEGVLNFNSQVGVVFADMSELGLEYRYTKDTRDQVAGELTLFPESRWSLGSYVRFDLDLTQLEEQSYYVQYKTRCLGVTVGYTGQGDDWDAWLQLWLFAFPDAMLQAEGHY